MPKHIIVICGPTSVGKSELSMLLAKHYQTEIISADSRQIYKHLNIGTAKPTLQELSEIKHHFIDFIELDGSYNAGQFAADAKNIITEIFKEHDVAIICGGTGLYIKALLDGIDNIPSSSPESRIKVNQLYQSGGLAALQEMLLKTDPVSFETLDIQNPRRISRALEVYFTTGSPLSQFKANQKAKHPFQITYLLLTQNRSALYAKIEKRVDEMIEKGLEEETRQYLEFKSNQALQTVGYKEIISCMEGEISRDEAIHLIKQHTRNYAKRQITWFNKFCPSETIKLDVENVSFQECIKLLGDQIR